MREHRKTITIRALSASFVVLALAVFKPFGLEAWQWQAYVHLAAMWALGVMVCILTDGILRYVVRMPRSFDKGVSYIIRRNLWFQLINTPLVALALCIYRHFVMSHRVAGNQLSWGNYLETLLIIAFCSFAIGLYWRFKFRSRFLAAELEEMQILNEKLKALSITRNGEASPDTDGGAAMPTADERPAARDRGQGTIVLTGNTSDSLELQIPNLLYIESVGNYVKVYHMRGEQVQADMLRATSKQMENELRTFPTIVRCHRAFLVNLGQVAQVVTKAGVMQLLIRHTNDHIPVSRSNMAQVKEAIKGE